MTATGSVSGFSRVAIQPNSIRLVPARAMAVMNVHARFRATHRNPMLSTAR